MIQRNITYTTLTMAYLSHIKGFHRFENYFIASGIGINILCFYGIYGEITKENHVAKIKRKYITEPLSTINKAYMIELDNGTLIKSKRELLQEPPYYWNKIKAGEEYKITTRGLNCPEYGVYPNLDQVREK